MDNEYTIGTRPRSLASVMLRARRQQLWEFGERKYSMDVPKRLPKT